MTEMSTRRRVYGSLACQYATIRLKAKKVSALKYASFWDPEICRNIDIILRSF